MPDGDVCTDKQTNGQAFLFGENFGKHEMPGTDIDVDIYCGQINKYVSIIWEGHV